MNKENINNLEYTGHMDMNGNKIYIGDYVQSFVNGKPMSINQVRNTHNGKLFLHPCGCNVYGHNLKLVREYENSNN